VIQGGMQRQMWSNHEHLWWQHFFLILRWLLVNSPTFSGELMNFLRFPSFPGSKRNGPHVSSLLICCTFRKGIKINAGQFTVTKLARLGQIIFWRRFVTTALRLGGYNDSSSVPPPDKSTITRRHLCFAAFTLRPCTTQCTDKYQVSR